MASIGAGEGKGRSKSLDAELNLVPFIDLLSTCICFLLITAVWIQIGSIQVKQLVGTSSAAEANPNSLELDVRFLGGNKMDVAIKGKMPSKGPSKFTLAGADNKELIGKLESLLAGFGPMLHLKAGADLKTQIGQIFKVARVTTKAGVPYGELVMALDAIRNHGIVNLGVVPVKE